jgi:ABC-type uncharacterized transport system permease subunit
MRLSHYARVVIDSLQRVIRHKDAVIESAATRPIHFAVTSPTSHQTPTLVVATITAVAAVVAGIVAQWFRVILDDNRRREQIRQVLLVEVAVLRVYLEQLSVLATEGQLPSRPAFWQ